MAENYKCEWSLAKRVYREGTGSTLLDAMMESDNVGGYLAKIEGTSPLMVEFNCEVSALTSIASELFASIAKYARQVEPGELDPVGYIDDSLELARDILAHVSSLDAVPAAADWIDLE